MNWKRIGRSTGITMKTVFKWRPHRKTLKGRLKQNGEQIKSKNI